MVVNTEEKDNSGKDRECACVCCMWGMCKGCRVVSVTDRVTRKGLEVRE